jgi:integrase
MIEFYISSTKYSLQERDTKRGKVYDVVFRVVDLQGNEHQRKLCGFFTKTAAKQAYTDFVTEKCELVKNNPLKKKKGADAPKKAEYTVRELFAEYITTLGNQNKESSIYDKQNVFRLFIFPTLGDLKMPDLTRELLYQWQDELWAMKNPRTNEYYSYEYLKKTRAHLSSFLEWCESRYGYKNNLVMVAKPRRKVPKKKMLYWEREEFDQFIAVVDDPMYHSLFTMLFFTGQRVGELFALNNEDIHKGMMTVNKSVMRKTIDGTAYKIVPTKAYKDRTIPICEVAQAEIASYRKWLLESDSNALSKQFLFGGDTPLSENTVRRAFNRYIEAAHVKRIRIHDLRHSFASMIIHLGANLMVVADLIGDSVEQVAKTYGHLYESDKLDIVSKVK